MKTWMVLIATLLLLPSIASAEDGYCKCVYKVQKEQLEQVTANSRRPVICDSCDNRCRLLIDRIKKEHQSEDVQLDKAECP